ncbi:MULTISPECIES: GNAT family N-acetyltransferase [unclassified Motilimonas]|uniref:GNAT family N-acetyltransferase n=1 Tax=Motilimonas TaxID=1914248 RepID=UPI001E3B41E8|nr:MULTISPECIES: GNAT family N-acetyltransferase [unclassified Motilimonas]MCE0555661.1 GNAT family N-acetyltransferase [Motilimonas sp. E26]MDO6527684.1 GNAT family N-acetyltransferase [Motilimonas sp. 1_MG-2023]
MPTIAETERLILRFFEPEDVDVIYKIMSNRQVMKFSISGPLNRKQANTFLDSILDTYASKGFSLWAVHSKADERVIGFCGHFFHRLEGKDEIELVYRLLPDYWGQGLASEAARAATDYAFNQLGLDRLISFIADNNEASKRVAESSGFKLERETHFYDKPVLVYSLEKKV